MPTTSGKRAGATLAGSGSLTWAAGTLRGLLTVHLAHVAITGAADKFLAGTSKNDSSSHVVIDAPLDIAAGADGADNADVVQIENNSALDDGAGATTLHANVVLFGGHIVNTGTAHRRRRHGQAGIRDRRRNLHQPRQGRCRPPARSPSTTTSSRAAGRTIIATGGRAARDRFIVVGTGCGRNAHRRRHDLR